MFRLSRLFRLFRLFRVFSEIVQVVQVVQMVEKVQIVENVQIGQIVQTVQIGQIVQMEPKFPLILPRRRREQFSLSGSFLYRAVFFIFFSLSGFLSRAEGDTPSGPPPIIVL